LKILPLTTVVNDNWVHGNPGKSWKVMEFKVQIFQAWKVIEPGLGLGKSWKINQMVAAFLTCVHQNPSGGWGLPGPARRA